MRKFLIGAATLAAIAVAPSVASAQASTAGGVAVGAGTGFLIGGPPGAIVGGIIGALILVAAYFVGVALIGAGIGALVVNVIWASLGREPHIVVVILLAIAGALGALALQRYVIIGATSFGGAWTTIVGALALMGDRLAVEAAARNNVWLAYPMNPAPGQRWVIAVWLVLGAAGAVVQLTITAGKPRKK